MMVLFLTTNTSIPISSVVWFLLFVVWLLILQSTRTLELSNFFTNFSTIHREKTGSAVNQEYLQSIVL